MTKTKAAFLLSCRTLARQGPIYLWTFTFEEVVPVKQARRKWNHLLTLLLRKWPKLRGIRLFQLHEEHGLHVHVITNQFINVNLARLLASQAGWGRINAKKIPRRKASYPGRYLSGRRPRCLRGWRLWAAFGKGWQPTKTKDVVTESLFSTIYRACKDWKGWRGKDIGFSRIFFARHFYLKTIEEGWEPGFGPNGKPYSECSDEELGL